MKFDLVPARIYCKLTQKMLTRLSRASGMTSTSGGKIWENSESFSLLVVFSVRLQKLKRVDLKRPLPAAEYNEVVLDQVFPKGETGTGLLLEF